MTKIPADIEGAAIALCEAHLDWPTTEIVMKAVHTERERCAAIARRLFDIPMVAEQWRAAGYAIGAAIQSYEGPVS